MRGIGPARFIPERVGLHRDMNGIAIGMVTGKVIAAGANMTITGTGTTTAIIAITTDGNIKSTEDPRPGSGAKAWHIAAGAEECLVS